jgi:hypothetical protein
MQGLLPGVHGGKTVTVILRDNLGNAAYNAVTQKIDFPSCIPTSRFSKQGIKRKALLASWKGLPSCEDRSCSSDGISSVKALLACFRAAPPTNQMVRIYHDVSSEFSKRDGEVSTTDGDFSARKFLLRSFVGQSGPSILLCTLRFRLDALLRRFWCRSVLVLVRRSFR